MSEHSDTRVLALRVSYTYGLVAIDDVFGPVPALYPTFERWNGFLCPLFDREAVQSLIDQTKALFDAGAHPDSYEYLEWDGDRVKTTSYRGTDDEYTGWYEPMTFAGAMRWGIGAYGWVWHEARTA